MQVLLYEDMGFKDLIGIFHYSTEILRSITIQKSASHLLELCLTCDDIVLTDDGSSTKVSGSKGSNGPQRNLKK